MPYTGFAAALDSKYHERVVSRGVTKNAAGDISIIEFWANEKTGTWTIVQVYPDGTGCQRASGAMFEAPRVVEGDPT
jgi:hypothetical protein